ncbi:hypothetical protein GFS31_02660 [Leptolyngbya sp. BL0902]|nr:hypothetical protein GFS31_02660 [Leptolyngbya sp. BL0902]
MRGGAQAIPSTANPPRSSMATQLATAQAGVILSVQGDGAT